MFSVQIAELIMHAVCVGVCIAATVIDMRERRIPNWLTLPAVVAGLVLNFVIISFSSDVVSGLKHGLLPSFVGSLALFLVFLGLNAIGAMGMGDVKLMAAVGAFLKWPLAIFALGYVLLFGAILSVIYAMAYGKTRNVLKNMVSGLKNLFKAKKDREKIELHHMPYALAILIGVVWTVLSRYFL